MSRFETIILVHGTFATGASWWQEGSSDFQRHLDRCLAEHNSPARCWAHLGPTSAPFRWSGANSEVQRRLACLELRDYLTALEDDDGVGQYHIVAHSLGGYVANKALDALSMHRPATKLGRVVFLGTPFLVSRSDFVVRRLLIPYWVHWLLGSASLLISAILVRIAMTESPWPLMGLIGSSFVAGAFGLAGRYFTQHYPPKFCSLVISSIYDEALIAIKNLLEFRSRSWRRFVAKSRYKPTDGFLWPIATAFRNVTWYVPRSFFGSHIANLLSRRSPLVIAGDCLKMCGLAAYLTVAMAFLAADRIVGILAFPIRRIIAHAMALLASEGVRRVIALALGDDQPMDKIQSLSIMPVDLDQNATVARLPQSVEYRLRDRAIEEVAGHFEQTYEAGVGVSLLTERMQEIYMGTSIVHSQYMTDPYTIQLTADFLAGRDDLVQSALAVEG